MKVMFTEEAWASYVSWADENNRRVLRWINQLIRDIQRNGDDGGIGKLELLRGDLSGFASRRIDQEHRLVYRIRDDMLEIISCRFQY